MSRRTTSRHALLRFLDDHGVESVTTEHPAQFHVGDNPEIERLPGAHTKNLFLKDAKGQLWLISAEQSTAIDLKALPKVIGSARLSFGSAALMAETLGVTPGSVTVFALINDEDRRVRFVIDEALWMADEVNFHPLTNTATTRVTQAGLRRFLEAIGVSPVVVAWPASTPTCAPASQAHPPPSPACPTGSY